MYQISYIITKIVIVYFILHKSIIMLHHKKWNIGIVDIIGHVVKLDVERCKDSKIAIPTQDNGSDECKVVNDV
jgi:hypothetical protein